MESTSNSTSRFRFRDHNQELADDYSSEGHTSADSSSIFSNENEEPELQSMTAKGVQHLCFELLELKEESDWEFQRDIFVNYSAFIAVLKEIDCLQIEMVGLKKQASSHKYLVKNLSDGISFRVLSEENIYSMIEEPQHFQTSDPSSLETHKENVSNFFDILLSECRLDDALALLKMEGDFFCNLRRGKDFSSDQLMSYNSTLSDKRLMICDQLILVAKNPRVSAPELQKALVGLVQLDESHLATKLLLQYYHFRIASGIRDVQSKRDLLDALYIQGLIKFIFSVISQAVKSFVALHGEIVPYPLQLVQWTHEEIEVFAACFMKYIASISEISCRLSIAVDVIQIAMSYCSLLESQKIFLHQSLIENIHPCIEEVLYNHIDHSCKVVDLLTSMDTWVLGKYSAAGILIGSKNGVVDPQSEYYFLTNSGRKFGTLFQSVAEEISPLIAMQMENSALKALMDLFTAYIVILESVLSGSRDVEEQGTPRTHFPYSSTQGTSIINNLSTLIKLSFRIIRTTFDGIHQVDIEIDNYQVRVEETYGRLKSCFLEQFISNVFSPNANHKCPLESCINRNEDSSVYDLTPSMSYLELYLEIKKLQKLAEDDSIDVYWLTNFFKEMIEVALKCVSNMSDIWAIDVENSADYRTEFMQLVLDTQFLVEIARSGGYLTDDMINLSSLIFSRVEESLILAGLIPLRDLNDDEWPTTAAIQALQKLQNLHATESLENENATSNRGDELNQLFPQVGTDFVFEDVDTPKWQENLPPSEYHVDHSTTDISRIV